MQRSMFQILALFTLVGVYEARAQVATPAAPRVYKMPRLDEHSYIRDSSGKRYEYTAWNSLVASGRYGIKIATLPNEKPSLIIGRLSKAERDEAIAKMPKPEESPYFKTGEPIKPFREADINGQPVELKQLAGKIVVLSFWYINNQSCRKQMADLNELVNTYKPDPNIVFLGIPMDTKDEVQEFLKTMPFNYRHLDRGKSLTSKYSVQTQPTDVVIDKAGKVQYHSTGYSPATAYWVAKTIEQIKNPPVN